MSAYYNEIDPYAAQWLRNLIAAGRIAPGDVDERSIEDVSAGDLVGYRQCHFFAGIGVWSLALRRAGVADDEEVWTGSCPCQPFSSAGKGGGFADERHLWPAWHWLISQRRPRRIYGEQVASPDGLAWLDLVSVDLAGARYSGWIDDLCSAGFGAPNLRQRLYFVAEPEGDERRPEQQAQGTWRWRSGSPGERAAGGMADASGFGRDGGAAAGRPEAGTSAGPFGRVEPGVMVNAERARLEGHAGHVHDGDEPRWLPENAAGPVAAAGFVGVMVPSRAERSAAARGFWHSADWVLCRDPSGPKWRAVDRGSFPLASGTPVRVAGLRASGNALNAEVATEFVRAHMTHDPLVSTLPSVGEP